MRVNGEEVACVSGSALKYTYSVPDCYGTYEYQVSSIGETEEDIVHSNVVSFTNVI